MQRSYGILLRGVRRISTSVVDAKKSSKPDPNPEKVLEQKLKKESPFIFKIVRQVNENENKFKEAPFQSVREVSTAPQTDDLVGDIAFPSSSTTQELVFIIQPNFKWGRHRHTTKLEDSRLQEAEGLVESLRDWKVVDACIEPIHEYNPRVFFGTGKVVELAERIRSLIRQHDVSTVFINVSQLTMQQVHALQTAFSCKVLDRYRVVLELFKERAKTKEAKLQVKLAELQYHKTHLQHEDMEQDNHAWGKMLSGGGETLLEKRKKALLKEETKIKKVLSHILDQYVQAKQDRIKKRLPHVALIGYTNAGKTTLAKCLSQDVTLTPEDKLFATLDSTAHGGKLPSGLGLIYTDTVGFISDLPHELVQSFSTTLHDLKSADLLVHVCDWSHPEFELQKKTVMGVLTKLNLPSELLENMIYVYNKIDKSDEDPSTFDNNDENVHLVSATDNVGLQALRQAIETKVLHVTGRRSVSIHIDQSGGELSWLYKHGTILNTEPRDDGSLMVRAILDDVTVNKFQKQFKREV